MDIPIKHDDTPRSVHTSDPDLELAILRTRALIDRALDCRNKRRFIELCLLLKQQKVRMS